MMIWAIRHRLAEPCHDRKLHSTDSRYSFDVGKIKPAFMQNKTQTQSYKAILHIEYFIICFLLLWSCRYIQCTDLHGCNISCCRYFFRRVRLWYMVTVYTQLADGVDGTPHPTICFRCDLWGIYQFYVIYTCDCTLLYTLMYCVCQHTDPGMAQIHKGLTVWGWVATEMVSEHMLTVGRDPRNRKALG